MRARSGVIAALVLAGLIGSTLAAQAFPACAPEEFASKNPERCAGRFAAAALRCWSRAVRPATCDVSKSVRFCAPLSASCNPAATVDRILASIYGAATPPDRACARRLALESTRLLRNTIIRARRGRLTALTSDVLQCARTGASTCATGPTLQAPCDAARSGMEASSCLCKLAACSSLSPAELHARAEAQGWLPTLDHALGLGYTTGSAIECADGAISVAIRGAAAVRGSISHHAGDALAFIVIVLPDGSTSMFHQGGGVRRAPDGTTQVVGPDGITPASR